MRKSRKNQWPEGAARFGSADDGAWRRSYVGLPATVGEIGGFPIKAYGRIFVYGASPDFEVGAVLQHGNRNPISKVKPKKSWEISGNSLGSMVMYQPRLPQNDFQPLLAVNLIDGDRDTCWCSRGECQPDVMPAWARIDLPAEERLGEIVLVPRQEGGAWPGQVTVKVSQDAWHWTTVYEGNPADSLAANESLHVKLAEPAAAKQIWVIADQLTAPEVPLYTGPNDYCFMLAEIEALDEQGNNVALLSRGAGVTVSSTNYSIGSTWDLYDQMWPIQYDLGAKWMRLSQSNNPNDYDTLLWRFVEQEKGQYIRDERTYQAMAEATANGHRIVVGLTYGNWLYTTQPEQERLDRRAHPMPNPPAPVTREAFEGYKNWVRFMVEAYKGTVEYWEIFNEPIGFGWEVIEDDDERTRVYCDLVKGVVPVIRETDPGVKISLGGMAGVPSRRSPEERNWLYDCLDQDVAQLVDAIGWHIQGTVHPGLPAWDWYPGEVRKFTREAEARGFSGVYMSSEYWIGAPYPPNAQWGYPPHSSEHLGEMVTTEMRKAKDVGRAFALNVGLSVIPFWCNTWSEVPLNDGGLFRNTFAADPVNPTQPQAAYYMIRTLCTVLEGAEPREVGVEFSEGSDRFDNYNFALPKGGLLVGVWLPGESVDKHPGVVTDVIVEAGKCKRVVGVDTLNGIEQELEFEKRDGKVVIPRVVVRDYPLMLRLEAR